MTTGLDNNDKEERIAGQGGAAGAASAPGSADVTLDLSAIREVLSSRGGATKAEAPAESSADITLDLGALREAMAKRAEAPGAASAPAPAAAPAPITVPTPEADPAPAVAGPSAEVTLDLSLVREVLAQRAAATSPTEPAPAEPPATEPVALEPAPVEPIPTKPTPTELPAAEPPAAEPAPANDGTPTRVPSDEPREDVPDGFFDEHIASALVWDDEKPAEQEAEKPAEAELDSGHIEAAVNYVSADSVYDNADTVSVQSRHMRMRIAAVVVCVIAALAVVYGLGVRRFSSRMLPNTTINGLDVGTLTQKEAEVALREQTEAYACTVEVGGFSTTVKGQEIAYKRDEAGMARTALEEQSAFAWPLAFVRGDELLMNADVTYDKDELSRLVGEAVTAYHREALPTTDVQVTFDEGQGQGLYVVSGTTSGTAIDANALVAALDADLKNMSPTSSPSAEEVAHEATVQDLPQYAPVVDAVNRSRTTDKNITVGGEVVLVADAATCAQWVWIDEAGSAVVDTDGIHAWAEYTVAWAVFHSDDWSNYYLDLDAFTEEFARRLREGVTDDYEAPTYDQLRTEGTSRQLAYERGGWNSEMGRYIDVDLEAQFARLFDQNGEVLWESAFVSGDMYEGHYTVQGTFQIYAMQTNQVLVGMDYDNDGQSDYESFVNYWMPFYGGYGLHDATWRSHFGGEYYYYNGSHGCVNLPYSKAEQLFNMTYVGETVYVHW